MRCLILCDGFLIIPRETARAPSPRVRRAALVAQMAKRYYMSPGIHLSLSSRLLLPSESRRKCPPLFKGTFLVFSARQPRDLVSTAGFRFAKVSSREGNGLSWTSKVDTIKFKCHLTKVPSFSQASLSRLVPDTEPGRIKGGLACALLPTTPSHFSSYTICPPRLSVPPRKDPRGRKKRGRKRPSNRRIESRSMTRTRSERSRDNVKRILFQTCSAISA